MHCHAQVLFNTDWNNNIRCQVATSTVEWINIWNCSVWVLLRQALFASDIDCWNLKRPSTKHIFSDATRTFTIDVDSLLSEVFFQFTGGCSNITVTHRGRRLVLEVSNMPVCCLHQSLLIKLVIETNQDWHAVFQTNLYCSTMRFFVRNTAVTRQCKNS